MTRPKPFQRILVALDSEGLAAHAMVRGFLLADRFESRLSAVHVVELPLAMWDGQDVAATFAPGLSRARAKCLRLIGVARAESGGEGTVPEDLLRVLPGSPASELLDAVGELRSDLLLLGPNHRRSVFDFGSTARSVLSQVEIPVWSEPEPPQPIRRLLVPTDFSEHSRLALQRAQTLAEGFGVGIRLLHCHVPIPFERSRVAEPFSVPTECLERARKSARTMLHEWFEDHAWGSVRADMRFLSAPTVEGILEEARDGDLIVMGTHGRTGFSRFLLGSVAYSTLKRANGPVLVVPDRGRRWLLDEPGKVAAGSAGLAAGARN